MVKNVKYPIEAFAVAMFAFSSGMKEAMIIGIGIIFGDILLAVVHENIGNNNSQTISGFAAIITAAAMYAMSSITGITLGWKEIAAYAVIGVLLVRHHERIDVTSIDYNEMLFNDSIAYGIYALLAIVREFISTGAIFDAPLAEFTFISSAFGKPMFALIGAGIAIAIINAITKSVSDSDSALWVCIPAIVLEAPFILNNVPEVVGTIVGIIVVVIIYYTFRAKVLMGDANKNFTGIPVEMLTLGMMYMIFTIL